jgi:hypothetical protein
LPGNGTAPTAPPRRKPSGKALKQAPELMASLLSNTSISEPFNGLPIIPKVKVTKISKNKTYPQKSKNIKFCVKFKMGAGLVKIFDQCPLIIHCACTWMHPDSKDQLILFGSDLGIYSLNLRTYFNGDSTLELVNLF